MTLKENTSEFTDFKLDKYVSRLKEPARRARAALKDALEKSVKRFQDQAKKSTSDKEKSLFTKKTEKVSKDLDVLQVLSEDEIVRYSLLMINKIMPIASNPRIPREERMKARVAAHKPLSTHLNQLKRKLKEAQEEEESGSEDEEDKVGSTLNKITFNNTVVSMRKDVRRAKVHIIHKLTRNIKKLRSAKGKEEKVSKFQRKAERLCKKVIHIKELHEDEISKFALSTTQNLSQLATDVKAPSSSQALATVAVHPFVATHVTGFKTKYPDWQKIVPNFLKKKKKKRKLNLETNGIEKTNEKQLQPEVEGENIQSGNESDNSESEDGHESEDSESEKGDKNDNTASEDEEESVFGDKTTVQTDDCENSSDSEDRLSDSFENNVRDEHSNKIKIPIKDARNMKATKEFQKRTANKKVNKTRNKMKESSPISNVEAKLVEKRPKVVDPFFVTTTNEEYVTSQVPPSSGNDLTSGETEPNKSGKFINIDYKKKWERTSSEGKYGKSNRFQGFPPYTKQISSGFDKYPGGPKTDKLVFGNRKERRKALQQPQVEEKAEKLHPSWEAKKKQSSIIPFQGKKVTFD